MTINILEDTKVNEIVDSMIAYFSKDVNVSNNGEGKEMEEVN